MTEAQIRVFLLAAEVGSIAKTSDLLFVSQPAVSKHLALLEEELEIALFERSRMGLHLTSGGRIMRDYLQSVESGFVKALERAHCANIEALHQLRVGSREGWNIAGFYPEAVSAIKEKNSGIKITLDFFRESELIDKLIHSHLDFILTTRRSLMNRKDLSYKELTTIGSGLLFSAMHPLANKHDLCPLDFKDDTFFVISENQHCKKFANVVRDNCRKTGFDPDIAVVSSVASAYSMIHNNKGVIIVAEWSMARANPMFRFMPIDVDIDIVACWINDSKNAIKQEFYNELLRKLEK